MRRCDVMATEDFQAPDVRAVLHGFRNETGMPLPLISVILPVYNGASFIRDAIDSVLDQTLRDFELIVVDDGSTDETPAILQQYRDPRFCVITQPTNQGGGVARNRGIEAACGRYIAMIDADDRACPTRLERQLAFMERNPDIALIGSWSRIVDQSGRPTGRIKRNPSDVSAVRARLLFRCCISHRSVMVRAEALKAFRYDPEFRLSQDFDLFVRMARSLNLGNVPEVLMDGRKHVQQISRAKLSEVKHYNIRVIRDQFISIGMNFSSSDLEKHFFLSRPKMLGAALDAQYVAWAAKWLVRLMRVNEQAGYCDPAALRKVCGEIWLDLFRRVAKGHNWPMWRCFLESQLFGPGLMALCNKVMQSLRQWR